jgi:DnaJ-class molecular chaperone
MPADLYTTLGVSRSATADEIKRAYRTRARELHPDVNKAPDAQKRFAQVQEAHEILADPQRRSLYDQYGYEAAKANAAPQQAPGPDWGRPGASYSSASNLDPEEFSDIFNTFFSGRSARSSSGSRSKSSSRSRAKRVDIDPLQVDHHITFLTSAKGGNETLRFDPGTGRNRTIELRIPPGIVDGGTLRVRGAASPDGSQDLLVTIRVGKHPLFRRAIHATSPINPESKDLYADLPLSIAEATLGASIPVPTLDTPVLLKVPPGIASGKLLRLQGRGIKPDKGDPGDLYFLAQLIPPTPADLADADRKILSDMALRLKSPRDRNDWPISLG